MRRRSLVLGGLSGLTSGLLEGCVDLSPLLRQMEELRKTQEQQDAEIKRLSEENHRQWSKMNCKNEEVSEFLRACEGAGDAATCSPKAVEGAIAFLNTHDYVTMYLRPDQRAYTMAPLRRGQLVKLTRHNYLFPTTRFLIIGLPRSDEPAHQKEALKLGEDLSQYMRYDLRLGNRPILGPFLMPCQTKVSWINTSSDRYDRPVGNEPIDKHNRVRLWCFRSDC